MRSRVTVKFSGQLNGVSSTQTEEELREQMTDFLAKLEFQYVNQPGPYRMHLTVENPEPEVTEPDPVPAEEA